MDWIIMFSTMPTTNPAMYIAPTTLAVVLYLFVFSSLVSFYPSDDAKVGVIYATHSCTRSIAMVRYWIKVVGERRSVPWVLNPPPIIQVSYTRYNRHLLAAFPCQRVSVSATWGDASGQMIRCNGGTAITTLIMGGYVPLGASLSAPKPPHIWDPASFQGD